MRCAGGLRVILGLVAVLCSVRGMAQEDADFRMEIGGGLGVSYYLGDVNTKLYRQTGVAAAATWRYLFDPRNAFKAQLAYGGVKGSADVGIDYYPQYPQQTGVSTAPLQYSFSSYVVDLSCMYEVNFWPYGFYQDYLGYKRVTPYLQLGMGMTYLGEPKAVTANLPLGLGVKMRLARRLNLQLDWTVHFSLSDKMDGLEAPLGITSQGIKNKDSYQLTLLTLTYSFAPICPTCNKDR